MYFSLFSRILIIALLLNRAKDDKVYKKYIHLVGEMEIRNIQFMSYIIIAVQTIEERTKPILEKIRFKSTCLQV